MEPSQTNILLPVVAVQHSFPEILQEVQDGVLPHDKFWVSCYRDGESSVHAKVRAELDEADRNLILFNTVKEDGQVDGDSLEFSLRNGMHTVSCAKLGIKQTRVLPPDQGYNDAGRTRAAGPQRITAFDVAPDSTRFATGYMDGTIYIYPSSVLKRRETGQYLPQSIDTTTTKIISKPHLSSVTSLKFFPSSGLVLTASQDFSLSVIPSTLPGDAGFSSFGMEVGSARTLRGHRRPISATAIIDVGKNVVSASLDASMKLWDLPSEQSTTTLFAKSSILSMSLGNRIPLPPDGDVLAPPTPTDPREVPETSDKMIYCGLENGSFQQFDLGFKKPVYISPNNAGPSITSIAYSTTSHLLATGSATGLVTLYDVRAIERSLTSFSRMQGGVEDMAFVTGDAGDVGVAVASSDGLPFVAGVVPEGPNVSTELVGADCDPVGHIVHRRIEGSHHLWTASDDGVVRRYTI